MTNTSYTCDVSDLGPVLQGTDSLTRLSVDLLNVFSKVMSNTQTFFAENIIITI